DTKDTIYQSVTLDPSVGEIFDKEKLVIGTGALQEVVEVQSHTTTTITGIFSQDHAASTAVSALGVFPEGILPSSTGTQLRLVGNLADDGTLYYARYDCSPTKKLTRLVKKVFAPDTSAPQLLLTNVVANPGNVACFQYTKTTVRNFTLVTGVAITISAQTAIKDPQTGAFVTVTESLLNISPRNVIAGLEVARSNLMSRLQPTLQNCSNPLRDTTLLPCITWGS